MLPHPIPSPLHLSPWDLPDWVDEAVIWVIGFSWPDADENQTWDVADRWYATATHPLTAANAPTDPAAGSPADAAAGPAAGFAADATDGTAGPQSHGIGPVDGVSESAAGIGPVVSLMELSDAIGQVIEEGGHNIEAAKLEAWIELVTFLIELVGMAVAVALTLGAATRAVDALIAATRFAIQQIFRRLDNQLARKAITTPLALA